MGTRTYLEEELEKAREKPKLRKVGDKVLTHGVGIEVGKEFNPLSLARESYYLSSFYSMVICNAINTYLLYLKTVDVKKYPVLNISHFIM